MASANAIVPALLVKVKAHLDEDYKAYHTALVDILARKKKSVDVRETVEMVLKRHPVALYLHNKLAVLSTKEGGTDNFDPQWSIPSIETEGIDEDGSAFAEFKQKLLGVEQHAADLKWSVADNDHGKTIEALILGWLEVNKVEEE